MSTQNDETKTPSADDNKGATDESVNTKTVKPEADKKPESKSDDKGGEFSREYVEELRNENKKHRLKVKELEDKLNATANTNADQSDKTADLTKRADKAADLAKEALDKSNRLQSAIEKRLINTELQQIAAKEGLIDMDAFKMVDLSGVKISDEGDVLGLDKIISDLKTNKPYLFKLSSNSSKNVNTPHPADDQNKRPAYETKADFEKAKSALLSKYK
jgi:hypothetical protein